MQVQNDLLNQRAAAATIEADYKRAEMQVQMNEALAKDQLISAAAVEAVAARRPAARRPQRDRAGTAREPRRVRPRAARRAAGRGRSGARRRLQLRRREHDELKVRAGIDGVLQVVPVECGRPAGRAGRQPRPGRQSQPAEGRNQDRGDAGEGTSRSASGPRSTPATAIVPGRVARIDPSVQNGTRTVDVSLDGELPRGAVPDLSVDGKIELERLDDVLFVGRPAFGAGAERGRRCSRWTPDGTGATRVQVKLGRSSVNTVEVVAGLDGRRQGDPVGHVGVGRVRSRQAALKRRN